MGRFKPVTERDFVCIEDYNAIAEALERFDNLSVSGNLRLWSGPDGKHLALHVPRETLALLSGATSPYSFVEVDEDASGAFVTRTVGDSGTANVYEVNGVAGLGGTVQEISWTSAGDWRFQAVRYSCKWTFTVAGCNSTLLGSKVVNLYQSAVLISTCTTNGSGQCTVSVPAGTYDLEVVGDSTYDTYTQSGVSHTCAQSTAITMSPVSGLVCGTGCLCFPSPETIFLTGSLGCGPVSDTCIYGTPPAGWPSASNVGWCGQNSSVCAGFTVYYRVRCGSANTNRGIISGFIISQLRTTGVEQDIWILDNATGTCNPFHYDDGCEVHGICASGIWDISG